MNTELSKNLMCVQMRSGVEVWAEKERVAVLQEMLEKMTGTKFVNYEDQTINTADIVGIFSAETMQELTRHKNGEWKCKWNEWHERKDKCECVDPKKVKEKEEYRKTYAETN